MPRSLQRWLCVHFKQYIKLSLCYSTPSTDVTVDYNFNRSNEMTPNRLPRMCTWILLGAIYDLHVECRSRMPIRAAVSLDTPKTDLRLRVSCFRIFDCFIGSNFSLSTALALIMRPIFLLAICALCTVTVCSLRTTDTLTYSARLIRCTGTPRTAMIIKKYGKLQ